MPNTLLCWVASGFSSRLCLAIRNQLLAYDLILYELSNSGYFGLWF
jgi:hypothetical protein